MLLRLLPVLMMGLVACGSDEAGGSPDPVRTCYDASYEAIPVGTVVTDAPC